MTEQKLDFNTALRVVAESLEKANKAGVFGMIESRNNLASIEFLDKYLNSELKKTEE